MKNLWIILCAALLFWGCGKNEALKISGKPQTSREGSSSGEGEGGAPALSDTSVLVSAFRFVGEGDAWKQNFPYVGEGFELVLYRDGKEALAMPVGEEYGVSKDYGMHHIYEGHLYTEFLDSAGTVIGKDGKRLFRFPERESLRGLLEENGDIYTLSAKESGSGFTYRKNGGIILENKDGVLFGSFDNPSYGQGGALYKDGDSICFFYHPDKRFACFLVVNGEERQAAGSKYEILDIKRINSKIVTARAEAFLYLWINSSLWPSGSLWSRTGVCYDRNAEIRISALADHKGSVYSSMEKQGLTLYYQEESGFWGIIREHGTLSLFMPGKPERELERNCFYFTPRCALQAGGRRLIAVNPQSGYPYYMDGDRIAGMEGLNGFLTGIGIVVSQPKESP